MSLFGKLKKSMGIGTVSFELNVPSQIQGDAGQLEGDIVLTAKGAQSIKDVEVTFDRVFEWDERDSYYNSTTNRHEDRWESRSRTVELGTFKDTTAFMLAEGETRTIHFVIPFQPITPDEGAQEKSALWNVVDFAFSNSSITSFFGGSTRNERVTYKVHGDVDLEDVAFDKGDSKTIVVL